jgi:hypothetical protein
MSIETTAIVCGHVFSEERPVGVVLHHSDGAWQLVCGAHDHPEDFSDFKTVGLEHLIERQVNLRELTDLPKGWMAEGDENLNWIRSPFEE